MATYTDELAIGAPPEQVWAVLSDVEHWPRWTASMTSVKLVGPGPLAVGAAVRLHQPRLPPLTWTVDELVPGRLFTWSSRSAGTTSRAKHGVVPVSGWLPGDPHSGAVRTAGRRSRARVRPTDPPLPANGARGPAEPRQRYPGHPVAPPGLHVRRDPMER